MKFDEIEPIMEEAWHSTHPLNNIASTLLLKLNRVRSTLRKWSREEV
jgi:hypothetical protein